MMEQYGWVIYALIGAAFAAVVNVLTKRALDDSDATVAVSIQATLMLLTVVTVATIQKGWAKLPEMPRWSIGLVALSGVAAGMSWLFGYKALQLSKVASTAPLDKLSMPLAVVLAMIFLQERPTGMNWFGIALMVTGAFFVAQSGK
ncbi:MAG: EamA family transporter [Planctomycetota bacterium]|nr:EamA family transporter [Planctomycetota bacterium]